ncbi:YjbQ family protein, partial [Burkholderia cenocepacia]
MAQPDRHAVVDRRARRGQFVDQHAIRTGLLTVFCRHTSASLLIQDNAD